MKSLISIFDKIGRGAGKVVGIFYQAGRDTIDQLVTNILPFMAFISVIVGFILKTGIGSLIAKALVPLASSLVGLIVMVAIATLPFFSPLLGPGAVMAAIIGTLIGVEIGKGTVSPGLALPALFAINGQCGCDFVPVGLSMMEAETRTTEIGVPAVLFSRFITGPIAVLVGWVFSIGIKY